MRRSLALVVLVALSSSVFADLPICVRDYTINGKSPCKTIPATYAWVYPYIDDGRTVCTRIYAPKYCETAPKEYNEVVSIDGITICVLNNNQPPVVNLCEGKAAEFYDYINEGP